MSPGRKDRMSRIEPAHIHNAARRNGHRLSTASCTRSHILRRPITMIVPFSGGRRRRRSGSHPDAAYGGRSRTGHRRAKSALGAGRSDRPSASWPAPRPDGYTAGHGTSAGFRGDGGHLVQSELRSAKGLRAHLQRGRESVSFLVVPIRKSTAKSVPDLIEFREGPIPAR